MVAARDDRLLPANLYQEDPLHVDLFDQLVLPSENSPENAAAQAQRKNINSQSPDIRPASGIDPSQLLVGLNSQQAQAVQHDEGPLLILAGAGSGKTRVITHRIAYLVKIRGVRPSAILAITFTNKAAAEMKSRVEELVGVVSASMWIGTFHSMLLRILRRFADRLGYERSFTILDIDDQHKIVKQCLADLNFDEKKFPVRSVHSQISAAKNALLDTAEFTLQAGSDYVQSRVAQVYRKYQDFLMKNNSMDFDDILIKAVQLLEKNPDVLTEYQNRFRYILVDEYQDTNHAQYRLVQMLSAAHQNLCVVGDDDQSIYSFRGANIQNILDFEKDFKKCTVIKLEQNYRSTNNVLSAANAVIAHNVGRKSKKLWTSLEDGDRITFLRAEDQNEEARYIAREISRVVDAGQGRTKYGEIAILYRLNALSRSLETALRDQGIPYRIFGGMRFYDRKEIKDVMAYLRLIQIPTDDLALGRIINMPRRGIGDATLEVIEKLAAQENSSQLEICTRAGQYPSLQRAAGRLQGFAALIERMQISLVQGQMGFAEYIEWVESESGLAQDILDQQEKSGLAESVDRLENLKELLSDAVEFENNLLERFKLQDEKDSEDVQPEDDILLDTSLPGILSAFLERAALYSEMDDEKGQDTIRLMTIHSAKGLEFRTVFVVGAEEGLFPGYRSMESEASIEEERRLAYVAITRAREKLYVTTARSRLLFGQTQNLMVSRFIREIPDDYLNEIGGSRHGDHHFAAEDSQETSEKRGQGNFNWGGSASGRGSDNRKDSAWTASSARSSQTQREAAHSSPFGTRTNAAGLNQAGDPARSRPVPEHKGIDPASVSSGSLVRHDKFGAGKIISITPVAGDAILVIDFDTAGRKRLLAKAAPLTKI